MTFVAGTVLTAAALNSELAAKTDLAMVQNAQTGTTYSYVLLDAAKLLTMNNAASNTVTVTKQATVTWVTGTQLRIMNLGAGTTTLVADTGVTINNNKALAQYQGGTLIRTASDVWLFVPTSSASGLTLVASQAFSGSASVVVTSAFTSAAANYLVVLSNVLSTASTEWFIRLRAASTDAVTNYKWQRLYAQGGSVGAASSGAATSFQYASVSNTSGDRNDLAFYVMGPNTATKTGWAMIPDQASAGIMNISSGVQTDSTQFDGINCFVSGGTISGTIRIYSLAN